MTKYDVIGDIHGFADKLEDMLKCLATGSMDRPYDGRRGARPVHHGKP